MNFNRKMQDVINLILLLGTYIALALVVLGGLWYLFTYGNNPLRITLLNTPTHQTTVIAIIKDTYSLSPLALVQLGLLTLVLTQIIRVGLLGIFYAIIKDYFFMFISLLITTILIFSLW